MSKNLELLAPAGSLKTLYMAANAGADAVYAGGALFGARAYADNFSEEEILEALDFLHIRNKSLYLTVNTLLKDEEIKTRLYDYLDKLYINGLDAVIVQDIGVFSFIKKYFPQLPIHCSTQMAIAGVDAARYMKELGATRVVTARELSLEEISYISKNVDIEIESFCHGALCYSYSGQCLMSSMIGGRSGNRGKCAQTCRLPYKVFHNNKKINNEDEKYVLSLKDMCLVDKIGDMAKAGIHSFKIEGRMKRSEYCAIVVGIYRKYMDMYLSKGAYTVEKEDYELLSLAGNRNGFSKSYYFQHNNRNMVTLSKPDYDKGDESFFKTSSEKFCKDNKEKIKGKIILEANKNAIISLDYKDLSLELKGGIVSEALNRPITKEQVINQMNKTGNADFDFESIEVIMSDNIFMPIKELNELRRNGMIALKEQVLEAYKRKGMTKPVFEDDKFKNKVVKPLLYVYVEDYDQFNIVKDYQGIDGIYLNYNVVNESNISNIKKICNDKDIKIYYAMPYVFRKSFRETFCQIYEWILEQFDGVLVRNYDEYSFIAKKGYSKEIITDYILYSFNSFADEFYLKEGTSKITLPVELNKKEIGFLNNSKKEMIIYGYIPLMISAQCIKKTMKRCDKNDGQLFLTDRYNKSFRAKMFCKPCYNVIYNSTPLCLADKKKEIESLGITSERISFTTENVDEVKRVMDFYMYKRDGLNQGEYFKDFTRGHFMRGIE